MHHPLAIPTVGAGRLERQYDVEAGMATALSEEGNIVY